MSETHNTARLDCGSENEREAVTQLPVIDISPFVSDGSASERDKAAAALRKACIDVGFFYISGHGISVAELDKSVTHSHAFFNLPLETKMKFRAKSMKDPGFIQVGGVNPEKADAKQTDLKERFSMIRNAPTGSATSQSTAHWPTEEALPEFSQFMQTHLQKRLNLVNALRRIFARSLLLPENYFDEFFKDATHPSLINYYPCLDHEALAQNQWSFAPHTDYGAFTILSQDSLGGLQVRNFAGDWIEVPPIAGTFVINIGDLMARWTNDVYISNLHRARNVGGAARISIPYFVSPHPDAYIECIGTCRSAARPQRYEGINCGEYIQSLVARSNATGRPGVSASTSERLKS